MERTKWTDRKFNFDFPEGSMANVLERLRGTGARILAMTSNLLLSLRPSMMIISSFSQHRENN